VESPFSPGGGVWWNSLGQHGNPARHRPQKQTGRSKGYPARPPEAPSPDQPQAWSFEGPSLSGRDRCRSTGLVNLEMHANDAAADHQGGRPLSMTCRCREVRCSRLRFVGKVLVLFVRSTLRDARSDVWGHVPGLEALSTPRESRHSPSRLGQPSKGGSDPAAAWKVERWAGLSFDQPDDQHCEGVVPECRLRSQPRAGLLYHVLIDPVPPTPLYPSEGFVSPGMCRLDGALPSSEPP
jgi:hypothetical protein